MRNKPDFYSIKAKKEGYPARSIYKLQEINNKFKILGKGISVLDIGASPGSWSLYTSKVIGKSGKITAVDLKDLNLKRDPENLKFIKGDVFNNEIISQLKTYGPYNAVISDAAPDTTGNRTIDTGRSFSLTESILYSSFEFLNPGGNFAAKIFQGGDEKQLLDKMKTQFKIVKPFKPKSCRKDSFEIFLIGIEFIP